MPLDLWRPRQLYTERLKSLKGKTFQVGYVHMSKFFCEKIQQVCLGISGMLTIGDGAHDLHLVVEAEEEEVEDGDGHHNNTCMRGDAQSIGTTASLWSVRWTGRSA